MESEQIVSPSVLQCCFRLLEPCSRFLWYLSSLQVWFMCATSGDVEVAVTRSDGVVSGLYGTLAFHNPFVASLSRIVLLRV
jgi:hypothetical protein